MDSPSFIYCNDPTDYGIGETIYAYVHFKRDLKSPSLHYLNYAKEMCLQRISAVNVKGRGPGINSSQSKNVGKIQLSMQLSHLSIIFENIWF